MIGMSEQRRSPDLPMKAHSPPPTHKEFSSPPPPPHSSRFSVVRPARLARPRCCTAHLTPAGTGRAPHCTVHTSGVVCWGGGGSGATEGRERQVLRGEGRAAAVPVSGPRHTAARFELRGCSMEFQLRTYGPQGTAPAHGTEWSASHGPERLNTFVRDVSNFHVYLFIAQNCIQVPYHSNSQTNV